MDVSKYEGFATGRLWVCANGPSLAVDYEKLREEVTMGMNFLPYWKELPFLPHMYSVTEPWDHAGQWEFVDRISQGIPHRFVLACAGMRPPRKNWVVLPKIQPGGGVGQMDQEGCRPEPPFSTASTTPLNIGVQFGAYMGFTEIFVLGMELSDGHVYDPPPESDTLAYQVMEKPAAKNGWPQGRANHIVNCYRRAKDDLAFRGVNLVNCTPIGAIADNFGYTPVDDVLGNAHKAAC